MKTLYYAPGAASMAVHWLLIELGVEHELKLLDLQAGEQKQPAYLALNPSGVVPTLVVDGQSLHEAGALLLHLADAHPEAGLLAAPGSLARARSYQWVLHLANMVQPLFRQWWYPREVAGDAHADAVQANVRGRIEAAWQRIDAHLAAEGPYLLGEAPSVSDFYLTMLMRWSRNMPRPATRWPQLEAHARRMKARPSFRVLYEREGLTEWD